MSPKLQGFQLLMGKKKPLTKSELMTEFKALEKKHEELLVENVKLREKLALLEKGATKNRMFFSFKILVFDI